jgi:hypothetical protein
MGPTEAHHHHDLLTDPLAHLSLSLLLSLALWSPFGMAALRSDLDVVQAGLRYLVAFLGCRVAVSGIAHLMVSYRAMQASAVAAPSAEAPGDNSSRRASDAA